MSDNRVECTFDHRQGVDFVFRNAWLPNAAARDLGEGMWFLANLAGGWCIISDDTYQRYRGVALTVDDIRALSFTHVILTKDNIDSYWRRYDRWTEPHFRHPVHHIIISTLRCNLACSYCHAAVVGPNAGPAFDLSEKTGRAIVDFAACSLAQEQSFEFQGGESLLNKDIVLSIIDYAREVYARSDRKIYFSIQTNATLLDDTTLLQLKSRHVSIGTSLDGPPEVHDQQRRYFQLKENAASFGSYSTVLRKAQKYGLATLPTITKISLPYWREIIDAQLEGGGKVVTFQMVYPINSAKTNWDSVGIEEDHFLEHYQDVLIYLRSKWRESYYPLERRIILALKKLLLHRDVDFSDFGTPCGMVHSQIAYQTNGDIFTCDEGRDFPEFNIGNVSRDSYEEVVFGEKMRSLKSLSIPNDKECMTCAYRAFCSACPVYERAASGEIIPHHHGTFHCKFTMLIFDTVLQWIRHDPQLQSKMASYHGIQAS